ncbi:MAG: CoA transferase [Planctomycetia bacterium]|nr:CoA transferase [Planctomycetia bacterium]
MMNDERPEADVPGILSGIRVVEVASYIFGPAAATVMSDFGADVIKVEPPGVGDAYRLLSQNPPMPSGEMNYCWILEGRNKRSVSVNLKQSAGRDIVVKLVEKADVFVTNYQHSLLDVLKLRYEDLRPLNPRLIYAQATGYGDRGDDVEKPGYDMTAYWARSGLMDGLSNADGDPCLSLAGMGDHPSAMTLFSGIMLALYQRDRTGQGTRVTSSLMANGVWTNSCMIQAALCGSDPYRKRTRMTAINPLVNHYITRDGKRFIVCSLDTKKHWPRFCHALGLPALIDDPRFATPPARAANAEELSRIVDRAMVTKDMAEWKRILDEHDLIFGPVPKIEELPDDPQIAAGDMFVEFDHPKHGRLRTINSPIFLAGAKKRRPMAAPSVGQHTVEVLASLGYGEAQIAELLRHGTVHKAAADGNQ